MKPVSSSGALASIHFRPLVLALWMVTVAAMGQSIGRDMDFKDLQRPGRPAVKTYPIVGLQKEADRWFNDFQSTDVGERRQHDADMRRHENARSDCNRNNNCYRTEGGDSKHITVRCLAGFKQGSTESISISSPGRYNCNPLGCSKSLHEAALSACSVSP